MTKPLILLILMFHAAAAAALLTYAAHLKKCPHCGPHPVAYPLSTGPTCGNTWYKIRCVNNATLLFDSSNNTYPITSISPRTRRLVIAPSAFIPGTCASQDLNTSGLQLDPTAPFNITRDNTVFFLNCTDSILQSPLNCSAGNICHVYAKKATDGAMACSNDKMICCWYNPTGARSSWQMIRLRKGGCMAYRSFVNLLDPSLPIDKWKLGVELSWANPTGTQI